IHIAVDREPNSTVLHTMVFYESPLSKHELVADSGGEVFKIKLKNFNPSDTITLVVASQRQVRVSVNSKAAGFTLHSIFSPGEFCGWLRRSYGGVVAYSKIAEGCTVGEGLSLSCEGRHTIRIPADFPPGRARSFTDDFHRKGSSSAIAIR